MKKLNSFFLFLFFILSGIGYAWAENNEKIGLSVIFDTEYIQPAYKSYKKELSPLIFFDYDGDRFYVQETRCGYKFFNRNTYWLSAFIEYDYINEFKAKKSKDSKIKKLNNRRSSLFAGLEATVISSVGAFQGAFMVDTLGHSDGYVVDLNWKAMVEKGKFTFVPSIGVLGQSSNYNNYYFGISDKESLVSGLKSYRANFEFVPYISTLVDYSINNDWGVYLSGQVKRFGSHITNSPMIDKKAIFSADFGVYYTF